MAFRFASIPGSFAVGKCRNLNPEIIWVWTASMLVRLLQFSRGRLASGLRAHSRVAFVVYVNSGVKVGNLAGLYACDTFP
jgi:hypothetical protein